MSEKAHYETTYIVIPDLDREGHKAIEDKFNKILADGGANIVNQEVWGLKKLAYPMNKKHSGYYVYTEFQAPGELIAKLEREYQYDERIIRFLTVKLDKHAIAWNKKRLARARGQEV